MTAHHVIEASQLAVPAEKWDNTVVWLLQVGCGGWWKPTKCGCCTATAANEAAAPCSTLHPPLTCQLFASSFSFPCSTMAALPAAIGLSRDLLVTAPHRAQSGALRAYVAPPAMRGVKTLYPHPRCCPPAVHLPQNYGSLASLRQVVEAVVRTPVASLVDLQGAHAATWDRWGRGREAGECRLGGRREGGVAATAGTRCTPFPTAMAAIVTRVVSLYGG